MLRFCLVGLLALAIPSLPLQAREMPKSSKGHERSAEKFLNGTDADRDAMLKDVVKLIAAKGYSDLAVVPWFVMMAKDARGREMLLVVDPVSLQMIEIQNESDETAAAAPEAAIPNLRN